MGRSRYVRGVNRNMGLGISRYVLGVQRNMVLATVNVEAKCIIKRLVIKRCLYNNKRKICMDQYCYGCKE